MAAKNNFAVIKQIIRGVGPKTENTRRAAARDDFRPLAYNRVKSSLQLRSTSVRHHGRTYRLNDGLWELNNQKRLPDYRPDTWMDLDDS